MADREYDRNRYRRMYDDQGRYGSGREYRSGRDVDTEYGRDRAERWTAAAPSIWPKTWPNRCRASRT
jgi:hypothetical protein